MAEDEDIDGVGDAGGERERHAQGIDGPVRVEKQQDAERAQKRAEQRALFHLFPQQKAAEHHDDGIGKMEYRRHARGKIAIGAEQQSGGEPAAEKCGNADLAQRVAADAQPTLTAAEQRKKRQRQQIAQKNKAHRRHALRVKEVCAQRHTAENNGAEDHEEIAEPLVSTGHTDRLLYMNKVNATIIHTLFLAVKWENPKIRSALTKSATAGML